MREIKFRSWDIEKEQMVSDIQDIPALPPLSFLNDTERSKQILMQYIGLKDKNGKEIYEFDIVKTSDGNYEIAWNQLHVCFALFRDGCMEDFIADWITDEGKTPKQWEVTDFEVIGNIYETPDLLKGHE